MAVDATALKAELGTGASVPDTVLNNCINVADALLRQYAGESYQTDIPPTVAEKAWLAVAVELFNQRQAPNGILNQTFMAADGSGVAAPVRIGADPLRPAYPLLERWVIGTSFA